MRSSEDGCRAGRGMVGFAVMWGGLQQVWELFEKVQAELSRAKLADEI